MTDVRDFPSFEAVLALKESGVKDIWVYLEGKYGIDRERLRGWFRREQERRNKEAEAVMAEDVNETTISIPLETKSETLRNFDEDGNVKSITSKRIIMMTEEQEKDTEFVLRAHGFDPTEWSVVNLISNLWEGLQKGGATTTAMYQSKLTVKPKTENKNITKEDVAEWYSELGLKKSLSSNIRVSKINHERILLLPLADFHFGNGTLFEHVDNIINVVVNKLKTGAYDEVWIVNIGDLLHFDGYDGQTTSGTQVGARGKIYQAWKNAVQEVIQIISAIREYAPVKFISVSGNHDRVNSFTAANAVAMYFNNYNDVEFDVEFEERKYVRYGNSVLGFAHGDIPNKTMQTVIQREARELYGETTFAYMFFGHLHHMVHQDKDGVVMYQLPSPTPTDEWHTQKAYTGNWKGTQLFTLNAEFGVEEVTYIPA